MHILQGLAVHLWLQHQVVLLWLVMISGCIGSHMPRGLRH